MTDYHNMGVAVIGQGFVGGSLTTVLAERDMIDVYPFDLAGRYVKGALACISSRGVGIWPQSISSLVQACEAKEGFTKIYFVCLPTPMREDGSADVSIVEKALEALAEVPGERIAVVKSTVPPGSTEYWNKKFEGKLHVVFNPEFLTEKNALDDMRNQNRIVLGGPRPWINEVKNLFKAAFPTVPIIKTSSTTAEMVKYVTNIHLAVKVALANELSQICNKLDSNGCNIDYDKVIEYATLDERLGTSHWQVPGHDGHAGFGGSCFVKDLNALMKVASGLGVHPTVMAAAWNKNLEVRPEKDWEQLIGRAVVKKE